MAQCVRYGPHALLLRFDDESGERALQRRRAAVAEIERDPPGGLIEYVPGFSTLLLRFEPAYRDRLARTGEEIANRLSHAAIESRADVPVTEIPVVYDGVDLPELAEARSLSIADVVRLHSEPVYYVHLLGFSPGFPYLGELNPALHTPRRATPRPRVAAGSVAIGGEHTGIYSIDSPGGWHIIGRTSVRLFDHDRVAADTKPADVFFLRPGDRVRFVPLEAADQS